VAGKSTTEPRIIMPEILFPEKWWQMSQEDYNEAKQSLKALIAREPDSGNAEVSYSKMFVEGERDEGTEIFFLE
jgi:hypothetical protein